MSRATIVEPREPGLASSIARQLRGHRPLSAFAMTVLVGYAALAAGIVALGLLLTKVLVDLGGFDDADRWLPEGLADHRSSWLDDASNVASRIGDVPTLPALVLLTIIVSLVVRRFRIGAFLLSAILMEVTLYRVGALAAPRVRPDVERLDPKLPVDESFPSGHAAASVVVYMGLALLVSSWTRRRWVAVAAWALAVVITLAVVASRIYRGMHHPSDVIAGILLGAGCLCVALVAVRAFGFAERSRSDAALRARPIEQAR